MIEFNEQIDEVSGKSTLEFADVCWECGRKWVWCVGLEVAMKMVEEAPNQVVSIFCLDFCHGGDRVLVGRFRIDPHIGEIYVGKVTGVGSGGSVMNYSEDSVEVYPLSSLVKKTLKESNECMAEHMNAEPCFDGEAEMEQGVNQVHNKKWSLIMDVADAAIDWYGDVKGSVGKLSDAVGDLLGAGAESELKRNAKPMAAQSAEIRPTESEAVHLQTAGRARVLREESKLLQDRANLIRDVYKAVLIMEDHASLDTTKMESGELTTQVQNRVLAYQFAVQALKEHQEKWPIDEKFALRFVNQRVDGVF
jgi:hypothetical protein